MNIVQHACANYLCARYGCQGHCWSRLPVSHQAVATYGSMPRGCVCPPGSEATCKGFGCPRQGIMPAQGIEAATADETQSGSAEGESPVAASDAPKGDNQ